MKRTATPLMFVAAVVAASILLSAQAFVLPRTATTATTTQQRFRTFLPSATTDSTTTIAIDLSPTTTTKQTSRLPSVQLSPSFLERAVNDFQVWALQHPQHAIAKAILPPVAFVEGLLANLPFYLNRKRSMFGHNFCCGGELVLGDFATVEQALTQPQARTYRLGATFLDEDRLLVNGKKLFSLALSDPEINCKGFDDGSGHTDVMKVVKHYVINENALQRQQDGTSKRLLQELAQDYAEMNHTMGGEFFTSFDRGLQRFVIRYQHYVLLGMDPDDKPTMDLLTKLYFESTGTAYFLKGMGKVLQLFNVKGAGSWPQMWDQVKKIYGESPVLAPLQDLKQLEFGLTCDDLLQVMLTTLGIAALPGPLSLCTMCLGGAKMPSYHGHGTDKIDPAVHWDEIPDLKDRLALEKHICETGRLWTPVSATHRVATTDMVVPMRSSIKDDNDQPSMKSFPAGTTILIPISLAMLDEGFWGSNTYEYDASRSRLCPFSMLFNSVGGRSNGRSCPGKDLSMNLAMDVLREVGQVRRGASPGLHGK